MTKGQNISISIITSESAMQEAMKIRREVFVVEQLVPPEIEYDEFEQSATHVLARLKDQAVGTARWRETENGYKLERFAVSLSARGSGVGRALVEFVLNQIEDSARVYLNSQISALGFYSKLGFVATGEIFYEANIPHRKMLYQP
ncbi:MAG: GNAT family N-acetyltransferase [Candidatus Marinimicrobia bacterium]|nr:GNAT family N-acetyltransferase [Candidatus Neomarinimicrobiota bacterium]